MIRNSGSAHVVRQSMNYSFFFCFLEVSAVVCQIGKNLLIVRERKEKVETPGID